MDQDKDRNRHLQSYSDRKKLADILEPNKIYSEKELTIILNYKIYLSEYKNLPGKFTKDKVENLKGVLDLKNKLKLL